MFLLTEGPTTPMHVSAIEIFEAGPLRRKDGGIDADAIRRAYAAALHRIPRYRQKLEWIPLASRAVWVDDPHFNLDYHVRHVSLPRPGGLDELKAVASRVISHHLDRSKPLWEVWIVEGLEDDRFALIAKTHHCMIDGSSGVEMAQILLSPDPSAEAPEPREFVPRPTPSAARLLRDEAMRWGSLPLRAAGQLGEIWRETSDLRSEVGARLEALTELVGLGTNSASETPINGPLGPHRRFDWIDVSLADAKAIRKALGCTINDVVLTAVTGAVRSFLSERQVHPEDLVFRVAAPVSVRREGENSASGNRVSTWIVELPIGEPDRLEQLAAIHAETRRLKASRAALGVETLMSAAEWAPSGIVSMGASLASGPINSIVTNVPGPQFPLYMLGARLLALVPQVVLLQNVGLGIALLSYDGQIHWGFTADYDLVPDLPLFIEALVDSFVELADVAGVKLEQPLVATRRPRARPSEAVSRG